MTEPERLDLAGDRVTRLPVRPTVIEKRRGFEVRLPVLGEECTRRLNLGQGEECHGVGKRLEQHEVRHEFRVPGCTDYGDEAGVTGTDRRARPVSSPSRPPRVRPETWGGRR